MSVVFAFINHFIQSRTTWWKTTHFPLLKQKRALLNLVATWLHHSFVERCLMYLAFCCRTWSRWHHRDTVHWCLSLARLSVMPRCMSCLLSAVSCCSGRQWMSSHRSIDTLLLLLIYSACNLCRLVLLNSLCWNSHSSCRKRNRGCWVFARWRHFVW